jgi:NAD(P)-dependent dehydrogenase (short-subunit alcohol dehydrogenase family)
LVYAGEGEAQKFMQNAAQFPSLRGRCAVVTGGASGIGAALVQAFCAQGARTAFLDIDAAAAALTADRCAAAGYERPQFFNADLTDIPALQAAFAAIEERFGPVRALINNAARDDRGSLTELSPESWRRCMALNLDHVAFAAQAARPGMARAGGGSIVNLSSNNVLMGACHMAGYVTAKAGIVGLTKALARELGPENIRVNAVMPGWVMTDRQKALWATPEAVAQALREQCLARELTPEDLCGLVLFLASDDSRAITKQVFVADGGRA